MVMHMRLRGWMMKMVTTIDEGERRKGGGNFSLFFVVLFCFCRGLII